MTKKINEGLNKLVKDFKEITLESRIERTKKEEEVTKGYGLVKGLVTVAVAHTVDKVMERRGKKTYFKYGALGYSMTTLGLKGLTLKGLDKKKKKLEKELEELKN